MADASEEEIIENIKLLIENFARKYYLDFIKALIENHRYR